MTYITYSSIYIHRFILNTYKSNIVMYRFSSAVEVLTRF